MLVDFMDFVCLSAIQFMHRAVWEFVLIIEGVIRHAGGGGRLFIDTQLTPDRGKRSNILHKHGFFVSGTIFANTVAFRAGSVARKRS